MPFATGNAEVAKPEALVTAVAVFRLALAPLNGALNVTVTPDITLPCPSRTTATSGLPNELFNKALCPPPLEAVTCAGGAEVTVIVRLAEV